MFPMRKYPRTPHLEGSRLQPGDEDLDAVPFARIAGRILVVEEKCDGANCGLRFDADGRLWLQSRGHFLTGGEREKPFHLFKQWAHTHAAALRPVLSSRYLLFGEWLYAKHTIFYDQLPNYFLEFDVLDTATGDFLSTQRRRALLTGLPIVSVPVLWTGPIHRLEELTALIGPSLYKSVVWRERLTQIAQEKGLDAERVEKETDRSDTMEGLYIKVEADGRVIERYKLIRPSFLTSVLNSGGHWLKRPIVPNQLRRGVDLFGGVS
ncbi:MAG TPA: RNA ligase family protein [Gemmataceae bacterium]|nr:RNA ligase family protein [Gemmataceae bacterium]